MRRGNPWLIVVIVGALIGVVFAGVSSYDFVQHLDRQVHTLHCSFIPGGTHVGTDSGCQAAMMSPYSSVFRTHLWGGIPISLPAMSVFAFLLFYAIDLALTRRWADRRATAFLAIATALPAVMSIVMLTISLTTLGTICKLCACIYTASALCAVGAVGAWRRARRGGGESVLVTAPPPAEASNRLLGAMFAVGVAFVALPVILYVALVPDHAKLVGTCDVLPAPDDVYKIMVPLGDTHPDASAAPAIELLDPLCPACKAFEDRLVGAGLDRKLDRAAVLFPLDNTCNWMVTEATHPGACVVSEAVLCAQAQKGKTSGADVIAWAFEVQERVRTETKADPTAAARIVKERFPDLAACVGSPEARARLTKSMKWAVNNSIRVLTPQLFIDNVKLCDEDVDLGLEFMLTAMLDRHAHHTLAPPPAEAPVPAKASKP